MPAFKFKTDLSTFPLPEINKSNPSDQIIKKYSPVSLDTDKSGVIIPNIIIDKFDTSMNIPNILLGVIDQADKTTKRITTPEKLLFFDKTLKNPLPILDTLSRKTINDSFNKNTGFINDAIFDFPATKYSPNKLYTVYGKKTGVLGDSIYDAPQSIYNIEKSAPSYTTENLKNEYILQSKTSKGQLDSDGLLIDARNRYNTLHRFNYNSIDTYYPHHINAGFDSSLKKSIYWQLLGSASKLDELYNSSGKLVVLKNPTTGNQLYINTPKIQSGESGMSFPPAQVNGLPFITRSIGQQWGTNFQPGIDFVPGGIVTRANRVLKDTERIGRFMLSVKGLLWNIQQTGLQLMNPNVEKLGLIAPTKIYNPVKLMLNIPGSLVGLHLERHGLLLDGKYEDIVVKLRGSYDTPDPLNITGNRLLRLHNELNMGTPGLITNDVIRGISGLTGPNSILGVGSTIMRKHSVRFPLEDSLKEDNNRPYQILLQDTNDLNTKNLTLKQSVYNKFYNQDFSNGGDNNSYNYINNFSFTKDDNAIKETGMFRILLNLEKQISSGIFYPGMGNMGVYNPYPVNINPEAQNEYNIIDFNSGTSNKNDYTVIPPPANSTTLKVVNGYTRQSRNRSKQLQKPNEVKDEDIFLRLGIPNTGDDIADSRFGQSFALKEDLVKLIFWKDISQDNNFENRIQFRAYIKNISEDFNGSWNSSKYIGRPDSIYRYTDYKRNISISFIVAIEQKASYNVIYKKLQALASLTMPSWDNNVMDNALCKLRVGGKGDNDGFIPPTVGMMNSVKYDIPNNYPWDISVEKPMYIDVSVSFTPIAKLNLTDYPDRDNIQLWR